MGKEKFNKAFSNLLSNERDDSWREQVAERQSNKHWLKKSAQLAIKINSVLRDKGLTQNKLAEMLGVSPQQVNKILKGRENLTLETISKIESVLGVELMSVVKNDKIII